MSDEYHLGVGGADADGTRADDADETPGPEGAPAPDERVGVPIPDEYVGAFVAQAFEDPERDTDWADAVDAMVAPDAREAWDRLDPREQVTEAIRMADAFDERALEALEAVPTTGGRSGDAGETLEETFEEALRCRRNADLIRDGVADAYATGIVDDDALVGALEDAAFDTATIAAREDRLETVAAARDLEFRPYGGTLFDTGDATGPTDGEFTAWED